MAASGVRESCLSNTTGVATLPGVSRVTRPYPECLLSWKALRNFSYDSLFLWESPHLDNAGKTTLDFESCDLVLNVWVCARNPQVWLFKWMLLIQQYFFRCCVNKLLCVAVELNMDRETQIKTFWSGKESVLVCWKPGVSVRPVFGCQVRHWSKNLWRFFSFPNFVMVSEQTFDQLLSILSKVDHNNESNWLLNGPTSCVWSQDFANHLKILQSNLS